eukprot:CAMPEP_0202826450 /NCGR_PEP_ID=MMETSP1389-20130828/13618_1 /ASSEMBLY_ACC=CAM_ASM_000865 /TAXON_ID=302021 /ORGANISM="Rhodomonas sp., Strain CCMP768" /LENGTH=142 /DNA_ID=CAMNT_0049499751 /DNA_START=87 /DNA_END=516 /DNA_ORIENTATION=-
MSLYLGPCPERGGEMSLFALPVSEMNGQGQVMGFKLMPGQLGAASGRPWAIAQLLPVARSAEIGRTVPQGPWVRHGVGANVGRALAGCSLDSLGVWRVVEQLLHPPLVTLCSSLFAPGRSEAALRRLSCQWGDPSVRACYRD